MPTTDVCKMNCLFIITINDSPFLAVTHSLEYVIEIRTAINDNHIYRKT